MVRLVRSQLATLFYGRMAFGLLCTMKFKLEWGADGLLYNVHVAVYFDWFDKAFLYAHNGFNTEKMGRYIWRKWFHWHGGRPPFLGYQKFAKPIGLAGSKPRDIQNIREFHCSLCGAVSIGLSQQELPKPSPSTHRSSQKRLQPRDPKSPQLTDLKTYKDRDIYPISSPEMELPQETQRDWIVSQYIMLLFRTGDDAHLSSPISFQSLYDSGKALPVNRPDCRDDGINVVRVKIDTALEFVFDLIHREREMMLSVGSAAEIENRQHSEACEKWVDGVMEHVGKVGIDTNGFTWEVVRRAKAAFNGEAFDNDQINPPWNHLGATTLPLGGVDPPDEPRWKVTVLP
ncbi:hypothetical protein K449DRAFT_428666 [Hypoxylon sp. EC38]|nr:hypothetical protein K449DRAFT_428666 [Hypoxylon sp. EC38]